MKDVLLSAARRIDPGDLVMVSFPLSDKTNNPAHALNGEQFVVKTRHKPNVNKGGDIYLYELHGAKSKAGIPYSFLTDELIKL